jgi:magnesium transporter
MEPEKTFDEISAEILSLLDAKKYMRAREEMLKLNEADIAEVIGEAEDELDIEMAIILFRMLPKDEAAEVFSRLSADDQRAIINGITDREINFIIHEMDFDDMIDVLEELPANIVDKILERSTKEERKQINTFLNYPESSAGSLMTPDYITLRKSWTVAEALAHIKEAGMDSETVYTCYVKDWGRKLMGIVSLRSLVTSDPDVPLEELMVEELVYVNVDDDQEKVSEAFTKYGFLAIPVVDKEKRLVGIITVDDILRVVEEEFTEDFERMGGVIDRGDREYFDTSVWRHILTRLPWLVVLMLAAMVTGAVINHFNGLLVEYVSLAAYMPMLMGTGGNSGSQAATVIIRGMAVGEVELKDALKVLWKEVRISFIIGVMLSILNFLRIFFLERDGLSIALSVSVSLLCIVIIAKSLGSMLPMLAKKIGIDPALMAAPMISSLTDMISCLIYFSAATLLVLHVY